ncbi:MAG TPA: hypothetical protein VIV66_04045 [Pyrinomonadaceae bacterium]
MKLPIGDWRQLGIGNDPVLEYAEPVTRLIDELKRLPSIGHKSAQRLAFHIMRAPDADLERLIVALRDVKQRIVLC